MEAEMSFQLSHRLCGVVVGMLAALVLGAGTANAESLPFRMTTQGQANPVQVDICTITNSETGTGRSLHLGTMTWVSNEVVNLCADGGPEVRAEFVLTAANGDQLFGSLRTVANFDFVTARVTFAGLWNIHGGTGRFQEAEGEGHLSGWGNLQPPFDVTAEFLGEIRY
jgi:hypothetical protein